ncbi:recombinase family protein [Burkholderia stagnalis]|uniref:recombinase family protein n=1 Tax=Burkholderia stagnalis TaxID=1503054 RepID=UPI000F57FC00|nr:recombinase family protein [Burkholderia stagnalis]RQQ46446.1 recombinase family protein [Burkholderia stagnalis]RQX97355.1 recombinase family protein [Burkholderia stagnalis]RQY11956.1 recombinase family protein [Burkholderia stagnalis]RQY28310.1 recombinase family protein [Burkholderia stagnalis]
MSRTFLYARVSTGEQTTTNQILEAEAKGFKVEAERTVEETISGSVAAMERPKFRALVEHKLERSDALVVTKLDRLGRNTSDVLTTIDRLTGMGVRLHCLALEGVDLTSATGKLHLTVLAAVAQFERDLLIERTHAGLARARAEGRKGGRPDALTDAQKAEIRAALARGDMSARSLAKQYGVSPTTVLKVVKEDSAE